MWAASSYPLSSDGIHNVKYSELVRGRTALKGTGDGINESAAVDLWSRIRQLGRVKNQMSIWSYVLVFSTSGDLCDGFDFGLVHAGRLQIS
jgi:hypothetical protein